MYNRFSRSPLHYLTNLSHLRPILNTIKWSIFYVFC
jgi:hypothetical protein